VEEKERLIWILKVVSSACRKGCSCIIKTKTESVITEYQSINQLIIIMEEVDADIFTIGTALVSLAALIIILKKVRRSKGEKVANHAVYAVFAGLTLFFCPEFIQNALFSPIGVIIVGTIIPIYESIKAVVSIDELDDVAWLQFWVISGECKYTIDIGL
jgi:hypothetical protein